MLFVLFSINAFADDTVKSDKEVLLREGESVDYSSERPRTLIPITCVYADGMVQLTFLSPVGEYTLTVTNQLTGERWSINDTPVLQTSTASGTYWVEIETEDGSMYYGTYTL